MKFAPLKFQKEAILDIEQWGGRAGLFMDMGLGKTICTIGWMYRNNKNSIPALVVCPASLKYQWQSEIYENLKIRADILETKTPPKTGIHKSKISIINYEIIQHWVDWIKNQKFKTIIIDESQRIKNPGAKCTKAVLSVGKRIPNRIALSGTPFENRPIELFTTLNLLRPDIFKNRWEYASQFCDPKLTRWGWDYSGSSNQKKLNKLLRRTCMIRYQKKEVLKDLPDKIRSVVTIPLSDQKEYIEARDNFAGWLSKQDPDAVRKAQKAEALVKIGYLLRLSAQLKIKSVIEWAERFFEENSNEKLVLFAKHVDVINTLKEKIKQKSVIVNGTVTGKKRKLAIDQFIKDDKTRLFLGNIDAAGTGIDGLQTVCSTLAFVELDWRPALHLQAEARLERIGQKSTTWAYYLIGKETLEERLAAILQTKQENFSLILDSGKSQGEELDVFNLLVEELRK